MRHYLTDCIRCMVDYPLSALLGFWQGMLLWAIAVLLVVLLSGCASKPPANDYLPVRYSQSNAASR